MTRVPRTTLELPGEVVGFDFLPVPAVPDHAILEFQTVENPVRVLLSVEQLDQLARKAARASDKIKKAGL